MFTKSCKFCGHEWRWYNTKCPNCHALLESPLVDVANRDVIVHRMMANGATEQEIIVELVKQKEALLNRIIELDSIAPRKVIKADGTILIWNCPIELIPADRVQDLRKTNACPAAPRES